MHATRTTGFFVCCVLNGIASCRTASANIYMLHISKGSFLKIPEHCFLWCTAMTAMEARSWHTINEYITVSAQEHLESIHTLTEVRTILERISVINTVSLHNLAQLIESRTKRAGSARIHLRMANCCHCNDNIRLQVHLRQYCLPSRQNGHPSIESKIRKMYMA